jgi:hypothetical protein
MSIVRRLFPQAPEIGSTTMIYLGVGKTAGRLHHAVVAGVSCGTLLGLPFRALIAIL